MSGIELALILLLLLAGLSVLGERLPWPVPITYVAGGSLISLWSAFPPIKLDPDFFFLLFVPPLLFADGWLMPLRDFWSVRRPVFTLATGLVVVTTLAVGLVAHWLIPGLPLAMAFALGAVISPTDAVAVGVITQKLKVPPRLTAILNGESLMNDATGLVAFKFALAAAAAGSFSLGKASLSFVVVALGGLVLGFALALFTTAVSGTAILVRLLWFGPGTHLTYRLFRRGLRGESPPPRSWLAVASWAGMRGTITLAAALSIPLVMDDGSPFPGREIVIFLAAGTIVVTLLLQGTTLEALICKLKMRPDDTQIEEDRLARITAVEAALDYLRHAARDDEGDSAALAEILSEYEYRLAELTAEGETQSHAICRRRVSREHRLAALMAEREAVDRLWRAHRISDETHRPLQHLLDYEEAMLEGGKG